MSCWPGSRPWPGRRTPSWPWWPRRMSSPRIAGGRGAVPGSAERHSGSVPGGREYERLLLGVVRLLLDRQRGNLLAVANDAREAAAMTEVADASRPGLGADLRALALISLGGTEFWASASDDRAAPGKRHRAGPPDRAALPGVHRPGPPDAGTNSTTRSRGRPSSAGGGGAGRAARLDRRPGLRPRRYDLAGVLTWQARLEEAEPWLQSAERGLGDEAAQPASAATSASSAGLLR